MLKQCVTYKRLDRIQSLSLSVAKSQSPNRDSKICDLREQGYTCHAISQKVNVAPSRVSQIIYESKIRKELEQARLEHPDSTLLKYVDINIRIRNVLRSMGIRNLNQLDKYTPSDILNQRNCGRKSLLELQTILKSYNIKLKNECAHCCQ